MANITFVEGAVLGPDEIEVGKIAYGTPFTYCGSTYIKINKNKLGNGLSVVGGQTAIAGPISVACNLKPGTVRALSATSIVKVVNLVAHVSQGTAKDCLKY